MRDAGVLFQQIPPEYLQHIADAEQRSARDFSDFKMEVPMQRPDGELRWMRVRARPQLQDGRMVWDGVQTDITERKRAEEAVRESEERLRLSNEAAGIVTFTIDVETGCVLYPQETAAMLGVPNVGKISLEAAFSRVHWDDVAQVRSQYEAALKGSGESPLKVDFRYVRLGGEVSWIAWTGRVDFREGPEGRIPFRVAGACVDITERKHQEERIKLLMAEVNHRSKNMLTVVQSIARQTASTKPGDFIERFGERSGRWPQAKTCWSKMTGEGWSSASWFARSLRISRT